MPSGFCGTSHPFQSSAGDFAGILRPEFGTKEFQGQKSRVANPAELVAIQLQIEDAIAREDAVRIPLE